jgi:hypothetical protein
MAHKFAIAIYFMLKNKEAFDKTYFLLEKESRQRKLLDICSVSG